MTLIDFASRASACAGEYFQPEIPDPCTGEQKRPAAGLACGKASHPLSLQGNQVRLTLPQELLGSAVLVHLKILYWRPPGWSEERCQMALFMSTQNAGQAGTQRTSLGGGLSARPPSLCRSGQEPGQPCVSSHPVPTVGEGADPVGLPGR